MKELRKMKNKNWNELWEETMKHLKTPNSKIAWSNIKKKAIQGGA